MKTIEYKVNVQPEHKFVRVYDFRKHESATGVRTLLAVGYTDDESETVTQANKYGNIKDCKAFSMFADKFDSWLADEKWIDAVKAKAAEIQQAAETATAGVLFIDAHRLHYSGKPITKHIDRMKSMIPGFEFELITKTN